MNIYGFTWIRIGDLDAPSVGTGIAACGVLILAIIDRISRSIVAHIEGNVEVLIGLNDCLERTQTRIYGELVEDIVAGNGECRSRDLSIVQ